MLARVQAKFCETFVYIDQYVNFYASLYIYIYIYIYIRVIFELLISSNADNLLPEWLVYLAYLDCSGDLMVLPIFWDCAEVRIHVFISQFYPYLIKVGNSNMVLCCDHTSDKVCEVAT